MRMILDSKKILLGVLLAHGLAFYLLGHAQRPMTEPEPIFMQAVPLAMGEPVAEPKAEPQKPLAKVKQKIKEVRQVVRERIAQPKRPLMAEAAAETPERSSTMEVAAAKTVSREEAPSAPTTRSTEAATSQAAGGQEGQTKQAEPSVSAPSFHANYLSNPKPPYPPASQALGEQGTVLLRVAVNAAGLPEKIELAKTSGFSRLDTVAQNTVMKWRFVPAKRGDEAVAGTVLVPVNFSIKKS
jgi:protein TonB